MYDTPTETYVPNQSATWSKFTSWIMLSLAVFIVAYYQILGESPDWDSYDDFFDLLRGEGINSLTISRIEPGFICLGLLITKLFASNVAAYGAIAAGAVFVKCWAISTFSSTRQTFYIVFIFYLIRFAPLHELTQLRVACATSLLLVAFIMLQRGNLFSGLASCATAVTLHFSSLVILPVLFLKTYNRKRVFIISTAFFAVAYVGIDIFKRIFEDWFYIIRMYQGAKFGEIAANPLSSTILLDLGMLVTGLALWSRVSSVMKQILMIEFVGLAIFYGAINQPVIPHRCRELLSVFWIVFVAEGLQQGQLVRGITLLFVLASIILYSYLFIFSGLFFYYAS